MSGFTNCGAKWRRSSWWSPASPPHRSALSCYGRHAGRRIGWQKDEVRTPYVHRAPQLDFGYVVPPADERSVQDRTIASSFKTLHASRPVTRVRR